MPPGGWIFSYILQKVVTESTFNVFELEWKRIERMYIHLQPINPQMDVFGLWEVHYRFMTLISNWTASKLTLNQCADLFTNLLWRGMLSIHKMSWYSSYKYKIQNKSWKLSASLFYILAGVSGLLCDVISFSVFFGLWLLWRFGLRFLHWLLYWFWFRYRGLSLRLHLEKIKSIKRLPMNGMQGPKNPATAKKHHRHSY